MKRVLGRFVPRTIIGQVTSLIALSSLVGVTITAAIVYVAARASLGSPPPRELVEARLIMIARAERTAANAAASAGGAATGVAPGRNAMPGAGIDDEVIRRPLMGPPIGVGFGSIERRPPWGKMPPFPKPLAYRLWRSFFLVPGAFVASIIAVFVVLLSAYGVRWITKPLSSIAAAADSFGRSAASDVELSERGPHEIASVARAMNRMRLRIRSLLDERTRMLSAISHDVRTPLTRLRLRVDRLPNARDREGMLREISRIDEMLAETLAYLRAETSSETRERADLPSMLQTICDDFADVGASVSYEGPTRFAYLCQPRMLARAITNLVDNAVKHASDVHVTLRVQSGIAVEVEVQDNGPGIPPTEREKVFEPFFTRDMARGAPRPGGFGLGLPMARTVIERHGGSIGLRDRSPCGLIARVRLPLGVATAALPPS
jgi:signal transduction histidine kinase